MYDQAQSLRELMQGTKRSKKIITITSGKGGVGKSCLSVNLSVALSRLGYRTLVIDADFGLANIDVMLGVTSEYNLSHVLNGEKRLADIVKEGHAGVRFISGGSGVSDLLNMDETHMSVLVDGLSDLQNTADIIIFDTGAGINDGIMGLAGQSSETIVVTTPEPTSIVDAYAMVKVLSSQNPKPILRLVMNRVDSTREAILATNSFQQMVSKYLDIRLELLGYITNDPAVPKSIKSYTPMLIGNPRCSAAKDIENIARRLSEQQSPPQQQGSVIRFFQKLLNI